MNFYSAESQLELPLLSGGHAAADTGKTQPLNNYDFTTIPRQCLRCTNKRAKEMDVKKQAASALGVKGPHLIN
jgi:hypothetical protein